VSKITIRVLYITTIFVVYTKAHVFSAFEYGEEDTITSLDSNFYESIPHDERKRIQDRLKHYGSICAKRIPLGYGGIGALLVFYYNTPNTTLPIIWGSQNGWIPLFRRVNRINGIESYYKQILKNIKPKVKDKLKSNNELFVYTEGKVDEIIFDILVTKFELDKNLGYDKISVVSLGGAFSSIKLCEKLKKLDGAMLFVFDSDIIKRSNTEYMKDLPIVYLEPSYLQFINITKFANSGQRFSRFLTKRVLPNTIEDKGIQIIEEPDLDTREIERYLRRQFLRSNSPIRAMELISEYMDRKGYEKFIEDAKKVLKNYSAH